MRCAAARAPLVLRHAERTPTRATRARLGQNPGEGTDALQRRGDHAPLRPHRLEGAAAQAVHQRSQDASQDAAARRCRGATATWPTLGGWGRATTQWRRRIRGVTFRRVVQVDQRVAIWERVVQPQRNSSLGAQPPAAEAVAISGNILVYYLATMKHFLAHPGRRVAQNHAPVFRAQCMN